MVFLREVLPWMLQSPLFPRIGMLMASTTQSLEKGVELAKDSESLAIKSGVLSGINEILQGDFNKVSVEVIRSVINLVVMEVNLMSVRLHTPELTRVSGSGAPTTACGLISAA